VEGRLNIFQRGFRVFSAEARIHQGGGGQGGERRGDYAVIFPDFQSQPIAQVLQEGISGERLAADCVDPLV